MPDNNKTERFRLHKAFVAFTNNRTREGHTAFLNEFYACIKEKRNAIVPIESKAGQILYSLYRARDGWYYVIYSSPEELDLCKEKCTAIIQLDQLVKRGAEDEEIKGICINPGNRNRLFLPKSILERICEKIEAED